MIQPTTSEATEPARAIFSPLPQPSFAARLARALSEGAREFASGPAAYLRMALLPARLSDWLPARVASAAAWFFRHPLSSLAGLLRHDRMPVGFINQPAAHMATFVTNALAPSADKAEPRAWDRFAPTLVASGAAHGLLIAVLVYLTIANMLAPYTNIRIVNKPYEKFSEAQVNELYARSRPIKQPTDQVLSLEELRERERQRALERERRRAEEEARLKAEREKAEREAKAAEEKARAEEAAKASANEPMKFGEINEAAIKDMIAKMFDSYKAGEFDAGNYSVRLRFRINCDGSIPRESIQPADPPSQSARSPQDAKKDDFARNILWLIGKSQALGSLCQFSTNTIEFTMNDQITRLSIAGFGTTPEWTSAKADQLKVLFLGISMLKGNSDTGQLARLVKVHPDGKRLIVELTVSRERANEMMHASQRPNSQ